MRVRWAPRSMTSGTREIRCSAPAATPRALAAQAADHGAQVVRARAGPDGGAVVLEDSTRLEGDVVVWACGPWLGRMFPDLVSLSVTRQELLFFDGGPAWRSPGLPSWCEHEADVENALAGSARVPVAT